MTVNMTFDELSPMFPKDQKHPFEDVDRWKMVDTKLGQALLTMVRGVGVEKALVRNGHLGQGQTDDSGYIGRRPSCPYGRAAHCPPLCWSTTNPMSH